MTARRTTPLLRRLLVALAAVIAAAPVLIALAHEWTSGSGHPAPFSDLGFVAAAVRNAAHFAQTLGPYSRYGFAHPGPAMFYLLAPASFGYGDVTGLFVATGLFWAACCVGFALELGRGPTSGAREPATALAVAAILVGFLDTLTSVHLVQVAVVHPWNPTIALAASFGLVASASALIRGVDAAAVPLVVSFVVASQSHVVMVPVALAALLATGPELMRLARRARAREPRATRIVALATGSFVVGFAPVVHEAATHGGGNLLALGRAAWHGIPGAKHFLEWPRVVRMVASPSLGVLDALGVSPAPESHVGEGIVAVALVVAVGFGIHDHRTGEIERRALRRLTVAVGLGSLAMLPALRGQFANHAFYPWALFGVLLHAAAILPLVARASTARARRVAMLVALACGFGLVVQADRLTVARRGALASFWPPAPVALRVARVAACLARRGEFSIRVVGKSGWIPASTAGWIGVAHGRAPRLEPDQRLFFGEAFTYGSVAPTPSRPTLVVGAYPIDLRITRTTRPRVGLTLDLAPPRGEAHDSRDSRPAPPDPILRCLGTPRHEP